MLLNWTNRFYCIITKERSLYIYIYVVITLFELIRSVVVFFVFNSTRVANATRSSSLISIISFFSFPSPFILSCVPSLPDWWSLFTSVSQWRKYTRGHLIFLCKCYWCRHQHHDGWPLFNVQRLHRSYLSCDVWGWMAFNYKQATNKISYLCDALYRPSCHFPQILHHNQRSTVLSKVLRVVARTRSSTSPPTLLSIILTLLPH